jgi:hypothetical protein
MIVTLPAAKVLYRLDGAAGPALDTVAAGLAQAGVLVSCIAPGTAYRCDGPRELLDVLAGELAGVDNGITLAIELPPTDVIRMSTSRAPSTPPARSFIVHGAAETPSYVTRAIDRGLTVSTCGIGRYSVTGSTAALVEWQAAIYQKTVDETLVLFGWSAESVAAEDNPTGPAINVNVPPVAVTVALPERKTTSEITRDRDGNIRQIIQLEKSVT